MRQALHSCGLLESAYLRLRRLVDDPGRIGRCRECGALFRVLRESRKFCSPQHANAYWGREKGRVANEGSPRAGDEGAWENGILARPSGASRRLPEYPAGTSRDRSNGDLPDLPGGPLSNCKLRVFALGDSN